MAAGAVHGVCFDVLRSQFRIDPLRKADHLSTGPRGGMNGIEILRIAQFLGANEVLAKPIRSDQLISAVSRCLGSKT